MRRNLTKNIIKRCMMNFTSEMARVLESDCEQRGANLNSKASSQCRFRDLQQQNVSVTTEVFAIANGIKHFLNYNVFFSPTGETIRT